MTRLLEINPRGVTVSLTSQASFPLFIEERWSNVDYCEVYTDVNTCNDERQYAMIVVNHFEVHKLDVSWKPFDVRKKEFVTWIEKILDLLFFYQDFCLFFADCTIFNIYTVKCQAEIKNILTDVIS